MSPPPRQDLFSQGRLPATPGPDGLAQVLRSAWDEVPEALLLPVGHQVATDRRQLSPAATAIAGRSPAGRGGWSETCWSRLSLCLLPPCPSAPACKIWHLFRRQIVGKFVGNKKMAKKSAIRELGQNLTPEPLSTLSPRHINNLQHRETPVTSPKQRAAIPKQQ